MTFAAKHVTENPFALHVEANHASTVARARATIIMASALAALPILCAPTSGLAMDAGVQRAAVSAGDYPRGIRATPGRTTPPPGRYVAATGQGFILGRQGSLTLLRFDRSNETWVLRASSAPRGDTIYRNDAGEQVLRVTSSGGMTLYSSRSPGGSPVSNAGGTAPSLEPQALGPVQLFNLMTRRSSLISDAVGRLVQINVYGDESEALCVEALIVTTDTVIRIARSPSAKPFLDRMRVITIVEGNRSAVTYQRGELRIVVDPSRGIAGRPSSARIIRAIIPEE
ncbi:MULTISPECIES: DUF4908 domain-containing protein [unclassified Brevundimonas]|uniref:DUF4908 domain-containing protein n=1 Tax=unclassified Brevundimonas TaxID=2622653 RepID=UPI0025BBFED9|nr:MULTISPECIES: DUF4908 domain-containing protein [unclassified Brevundimonas]